MDATLRFIQEHSEDDVKSLALRAHGLEGVDLPFALDQIAGRQTAKRKLPSWAAVDSVVYPPHISMEQCSSELTALYKKSVLDRLIFHSSFLIPHSPFIIDLTGGFGVDFSFMSRGFSRAVYVERQEHLCEMANHNFRCLGLDNVEVECEEAEEYLAGIRGVSLGSDAFFPFSDNIKRARRSGVDYVAEPGGSIRDDEVIRCCDEYNMVMAFTGMRLFHH